MSYDIVSSADDFNRAMTLWLELTDLDPNAKRWSGYSGWDIRRINEELKLSMEYDPSLATTYLLLDAWSADYFKEAKLSVADFDTDEDAVFDYMAKVREFKKLIRSPDVAHMADTFLDTVRRALLQYNIDSGRINKFLADRANLAFIRRDALKSINRLRVDQFLKGETDPEGTVPVYNRSVYGYWNINSMIEHVCAMPSGMSLNLIRDPDELHSYFAIAVRNGGNLLFLTDVPEYSHPLGRYMSRRPDKAFAERAGRNWFPYQLLAIKYDEDGNPFHDKYREAVAQNLVPHQPSYFELKKFADLELPEIVWTTLVFDLIHERYWKQPMPVLELSYTNEMIRLQDQGSLISAATRSNLPVTGYQPLNLPRLTTADMTTDKLDETALGRMYDGTNEQTFGSKRWMEERYGHLVPEEALNLIGVGEDTALFLAYHDDKPLKNRWASDGEAKIVPVADSDVKRITIGDGYFARREPFRELDTQNNPIYSLEKVDGTLFGTCAQIDADRKFIARINYAKGIQREADREFMAERPKVMKWWFEKVEANIDRLLAYAHFERTLRTRANVPGFARKDDPTGLEKYNFSGMILLKGDESIYDWGQMDSAMVRFCDDGTTTAKKGEYDRCYITGAKATWKLYLEPGCAQDLCMMTGTAFEDLPTYLQNWYPGDDPYTGNSILDRIDPLEWKLDNPWDQVSFAVAITLSKRGRAQIMKTHPAPELPVVSNIARHGQTQVSRNISGVSHSDWKAHEYIKELKTND